MRTLLRTTARLAGTAAVATVVLAGTATPASATSTSCAFYGDGLRGMVRNGQFCATVVGSGTDVRHVTNSFGTTIPGRNSVCNASIKIDVYDRWGSWATWRQGAQARGCTWGSWNTAPTLPVHWGFPAARGGYVKVTLQSYGADVASTVHRLG